MARDFLAIVRGVHGGALPTEGLRVTKFCTRAKAVDVACPVHAEACPLRKQEKDDDAEMGVPD